MFKRLKALVSRSADQGTDKAGATKAGKQPESPEMERIRANQWPSLEHITLALCAPSRSTILKGNDPFLNELGHVDEQERQFIQDTLKSYFNVVDIESMVSAISNEQRMENTLRARIMIMDIVTSAVDAGICTFDQVTSWCLDAMDQVLLNDSIQDWNDYTKEILTDPTFENEQYASSLRVTCQELMDNPNSPWSIFTLDQIKTAFVTDHCDLERRKHIRAFMANLSTPSFDQIALALCAPFRDRLTYGPITRLFAYGEMNNEELAKFIEQMHSFNLTKVTDLRSTLNAFTERSHLPFFAAFSIFLITSGIELGLITTAEYQDELKTHMATILDHPEFNEWNDLAMNYYSTNIEYNFDHLEQFDAVLVELMRQGNSPWQVFSWDLVKSTFNEMR